MKEITFNKGHLRYKTSVKERAFEYMVLSFIDWWVEANPEKDFKDNDLGILKVMKMLFFTVGVSANRDTEGLLTVFNNWYAQPYGHVELDIQELIKYREGKFKNFTITTKGITLTSDYES